MADVNETKTLLNMTLEEARAIIRSCTKEEIQKVFADAKKAAENIRMREDIYCEPLSYEMMHQPLGPPRP